VQATRSMCVCKYVCMHICMCACMYVSMYECMCVCSYGCVYVNLPEKEGGGFHPGNPQGIHTYIFMYVYAYVYI